MYATEMYNLAVDALRRCGLKADVQLHAYNEVCDEGCDGYVSIDCIDIYPALVGDQIGWGVSATVLVPGVHTMPNGDPGYPDDADVVDIASHKVLVKSIAGERWRPRSAVEALKIALPQVVAERLDYWPETLEVE